MADEQEGTTTSTPTPEEQIAELTAKLEALTGASETQAAEVARLSKDKEALLKDLKKAKDEREKLRQAQMTEEEKTKADLSRLSELETALEKERSEALKYRILSTTDHGLDPVFARLVEGSDEASVNASIEALKAEQAEMSKRLAPQGGRGTAPPPPPAAGGPQPLMLSEEDIRRMTPAQFSELETKIKTGEVVLP